MTTLFAETRHYLPTDPEIISLLGLRSARHHHYFLLNDAGKLAKVAFMAIMRKLILLANVLIKQDRMWTQIKT